MKVLHLINDLYTGGAQAMLWKLVGAATSGDLRHAVIALSRGGAVRERIAETGTLVDDLGGAKGRIAVTVPWQLATKLRAQEPDIVQGWMYHGNLAALLGAKLAGRRCPVIWNVRHSLHDIAREKRLTRVMIRLGARLSRSPAAIVYNSAVAARQHEQHGYDGSKTNVIPNGFDTDIFRPDPEAKVALARALDVDPAAILIGIVARPHPMKDHANVIAAVSVLVAKGLDVILVMVGEGSDWSNEQLAAAIRRAGIEPRVALLGERHDMPRIVPGLDINVLCSAWGEGFPNTIGEAMASGVPCVATDVGDCRWIIGDTGMMVPPGDSTALAAALEHLIASGPEVRRRLGDAARARIQQNFAIAAIVRQYEALYEHATA